MPIAFGDTIHQNADGILIKFLLISTTVKTQPMNFEVPKGYGWQARIGVMQTRREKTCNAYPYYFVSGCTDIQQPIDQGPP
jgi:hypothetical protein